MCMEVIFQKFFHTKSKLHISNPEQFAKWILANVYGFKEEAVVS